MNTGLSDTEVHAVDPEAARALFDAHLWGDDEMVRWIRVRAPQTSEEAARDMLEFMKNQ